jgi:hypothetical protein
MALIKFSKQKLNKLNKQIMKKLVLTFASILLISVMAANAQELSDTTKTSTGKSMSESQEESSQAVGKKDLVRVQTNDVPAALRKTLEDPMYAGWENSTIWRNKTTDEYTVEILNGTTTKTYRFDKNGKPIIDKK